MSPDIEASGPQWKPPPPDECTEDQHAMTLDGADPAKDRVMARLVNDAQTWELVDFALIQQTYAGSKWHDVAKIDSAHDDEIHVHRYGKRSGEHHATEHLMPITCAADVQAGYSSCYQVIFDNWAENKRKWQDG
jgi:hypothetical protein